MADIRRPSAIQILLNLLKRRKEQDIVFALALDLTPKGRVVYRDDAVKTKALASLTLENFEYQVLNHVGSHKRDILLFQPRCW